MAKRKPTSILRRSNATRKKPKIVKAPAGAQSVHKAKADRGAAKAGQAPTASKHCWQAASIVDRQAAHAVAALLRADETGGGGASIKSLTLGPAVAAKKATHAVTCETLRMLPVIRQAADAAGLLQAHGQLPAATAFVLCYELLFGEGLRQKGPAERAVLGALPSLRAAVAALQQAAGVGDARELVGGAAPQRAALQSRPRAARVNTLKMSVAEALSWLRCPPQAHAQFSGTVQLLLLVPLSSHAHASLTGVFIVTDLHALCWLARGKASRLMTCCPTSCCSHRALTCTTTRWSVTRASSCRCAPDTTSDMHAS